MIESWLDVFRLAAAGSAGGLVYWAAREHGAVFALLWRRLRRR